MPSNPEKDEGGRLWRRKAHSLDLGGSSRERSKAAAWMWHMHTNESPVQYAQKQASDAWESKRRSSCDGKDSRFRQEAFTITSPPLIKGASHPSSTVWDCGSRLYDTFELVSFSNRLDRSLLGLPAVEAPSFHHAQSPLHHASMLRTLSLPRTSLSRHSSASATPPHSNSDMAARDGDPSVHGSMDAITPCSSNAQGLVAAATSKPSHASHTYFAKWLAKFVKKVVGSHGQMWCFKPLLEQVEETVAERSATVRNGLDEGCGMSEREQREWERERYRVYEEKVEEGHKHFHHHHHHYHHHFLHRLDQSTQDAEACNYKRSTMSPDAESARLSFETMSKIYADKNGF